MSILLLFGGAEVVADGGAFIGDLQGVAVLSEALELADVQSLLTTAQWSDVSDDVEIGVTIDRGIHEDSPLARLAATGTCSFTLDNSEYNSAGLIGYYSPPNANARSGFDRGTMVRVSMVSQDGLIPQFVGKIQSIKPIAGIYRERRTEVFATDWLDEAARHQTQGLETQQNVRADQLLELLVDNMRNRPHAIAFDHGTDVYPFALDTSMDLHRVQWELMRIVNSERGLIYVRGDGTLVFESRYARTLNTTAEYDLSEVLDADQERSTEHIVNRVRATIFPRRPSDDDETILYSNDSTPRFDHATTSTVFLPFRDPDSEATRIGGMDLHIPPTPTTDYLINSAEDGSGPDLTTHPGITLTWVKDATGVYLTVENQSGQAAYFTLIQVRGRALYHYDPVTLVASNEDSIAEHGVQQVDFEMPYQDRVGVGRGSAQLILNTFNATPTRVSEVPFYLFQSDPHRRLGAYADISTRVSFSELVSGVDAEYFINGKRIEWPVNRDVDVTMWLAPAENDEYAVFDVSLFDDPAARFAF